MMRNVLHFAAWIVKRGDQTPSDQILASGMWAQQKIFGRGLFAEGSALGFVF